METTTAETLSEPEGPFVLLRYSTVGRRGQWYTGVADSATVPGHRYATVAATPREARQFATINEARTAELSGGFTVRSMSAYNRT